MGEVTSPTSDTMCHSCAPVLYSIIFIVRFMTGDETWVAHITPETKRSVHRRHSGSPCKTKLEQKVMFTVFWDRLVQIPGGRVLRHGDTKVEELMYKPS